MNCHNCHLLSHGLCDSVFRVWMGKNANLSRCHHRRGSRSDSATSCDRGDM